MRQLRSVLIVLAAAVLAVGTAQAFHDGGVARCSGCHTMHDGSDVYTLIQGSDPSSTCLNCHDGPTLSSYHVSTSDSALGAGSPPLNLTPGGDFGWLKKTYTWSAHGRSRSEQGYTHGHNIVAADFLYDVDGRAENATAPGGVYPNTDLSCTSCHDPHGRYRRTTTGICVPGVPGPTDTCDPIMESGSYDDSPAPVSGAAVGVYRLLGGAGFGPGFNGVPVAVAPGSYNRPEDTTQTRVAYGYDTNDGEQIGWAAWCGECHTDMHVNDGNAPFRHKVDSALGAKAAIYEDYVKTGDMSGLTTNAYLSLVPFSYNGTNGSDYAFLAGKATSSTTPLDGPASGDQVTCFSCHRAHASGWAYGLRWNGATELLTWDSAWPDKDDPDSAGLAMGRDDVEIMKAYYDRPADPTFANYQRSLCNKCHAKD